MAEYFNTFVRFILYDGVSNKLLGISREAGALNTQLAGIRGTMMKTFAMYEGYRLAAGILKEAAVAGTDYLHALNQLNMAGLTSVEVSKAQAAAWETTSKVQMVSASEALQMFGDLRYTMGSVERATEFLPKMALMTQIFAASATSGDTSKAREMALSAMKVAELTGRSMDPAQFTAMITGIAKSMAVTAGRVKPEVYQATLKFARGSGLAVSDKFLYQEFPTFMQEWITSQGGGGGRQGVGSMLQSMARLYGAVGGLKAGGVNKQLKVALSQFGLWNQKGIKDPELLASNFIEWTWKYLSPIIEKKYGTDFTDEKVRAKIGIDIAKMFPNQQILQQAFMQAIVKRELVLKDVSMYEQLQNKTLEQMGEQAKTSFDITWSSFKTQLVNLGAAVGAPALTRIQPVLQGLTAGLTVLNDFLRGNSNFLDRIHSFFSMFAGILPGTLPGITSQLSTANGALLNASSSSPISSAMDSYKKYQEARKVTGHVFLNAYKVGDVLGDIQSTKLERHGWATSSQANASVSTLNAGTLTSGGQ
jgi:hypothetical protein